MAKPKMVPWPAEPHTIVKHRVYERYLSKWMPILVQSWKGAITYAEGFAGPGVYSNGEPGSPVIALKTLLDDPALRRRARDLRFLFVDVDRRCTDRLRQELTRAAVPVPLHELHRYGIDLEIVTGDYDPALTNLLTAHNAWGRPMLVVLDSFGGGVKLELVRRIAANPSSEVIITFDPKYFARFASVNEIEHGDTVFGNPEWRRVDQLPEGEKKAWVVAEYRRVLAESGFPFILTFELVNQRGGSLFLVFGTTHPKGLIKMKEAMWEVDPITGVQYRDPADPNQQLLDIRLDPVTEPLARALIEYLRGQPDRIASVSDLRRHALYQTVYKESQVKPVLDTLLARGDVAGDGPGGSIRLGGSVQLVDPPAGPPSVGRDPDQ